MTDHLTRDAFSRWRYPWHWRVNSYMSERRENGEGHESFMYEAMSIVEESMRLPLLFKAEREGALTKIHQQCSHSQTETVYDNHLTCCLGVECRTCPHLLALDGAELDDDQIDIAKAFTCISHILANGGDSAGEGYLLTTDDRMYWDRVYQNLAAEPPEDT